MTRAKAVDACRDSASGAAIGANGALRIDAERHFLGNGRLRIFIPDSGLMQVGRAFRGNVRIYGRLWLRRPRL